MDFAVYDPRGKVLWLLEVKDYKTNPRTKQIDLAEDVALKVRDSLAFLRIAKIKDEGLSGGATLTAKEFALLSDGASSIRVVLHCELPPKTSKIFPGVKDSANLQQKLRTKLRCVDSHALVVDVNSTRSKCQWGVKTI